MTVPLLPETIQRAIPPFKLYFTLSTPMDENELDDGDLAELAETTDLHLTMHFTECFTTEPTDFHEVNVTVQKTSDPSTVRFFVSPSFVIPGE